MSGVPSFVCYQSFSVAPGLGEYWHTNRKLCYRYSTYNKPYYPTEYVNVCRQL